jgi:MerR family transcriptional regulator, mercuric resistance operon regulatory protein
VETTRLVTIGALSERTGVNIETIRYYECIGILPKPPRIPGGHRLYGELYAEEYRWRLVFVRRARDLGFSIDDVCALLELTGGRRMACAKVKRITEKRIADIRQKVNELKRLEHTLRAHGHPMPRR